MLIAGRFYVYRLFDEWGAVQYVGKGSGRRLHNQRRRFRLGGEVVCHFKSEAAAYEFERACIADWNPPLNRHPGGNGSRVRRKQRQSWEIVMDRIGVRAYAARLLLATGQITDPSKLDAIRQVAYGPRSQDRRQAEGHA